MDARLDDTAMLAAANKRGLLIWLPAAIGQRVYVPSGDGGIYTARVK